MLSRHEVGQNNATSALQLFAVRSYGSMLLIESNLAKHQSLAFLLSLSRYGIDIFLLLLQFGDLNSSKQLYQTASFVRDSSCRLLFTSAVKLKWGLRGVSTKKDMKLTKTDYRKVYSRLNFFILLHTKSIKGHLS